MNKTSTIKQTAFLLGILGFGLLFLFSRNLYSQDTGFKYFKNYSNIEYDHHPQNWGIAQGPNRIIYVANQAGLLIFDGVSWRVRGIPDYTTVRSLAIDESGTIYIGGNGKIGYFASDAKGFLKYFSLMDHLEEKQRNFTSVWRTHATKEGIYFRTSTFIFRWDSRKMETWESPSSFRSSFVYNGSFFVQEEEKGLMQMINNSLTLVPGGETFAEEKIWMMVPYGGDGNSNTLLLGTRTKGFYLYDGAALKHFPLTKEVEDYLGKNSLYYGSRLSSNDFALATYSGGLIIMDPRGRLKYIFNKTTGIQDNFVKCVFEDAQGNLWLPMDKGICKIEYKSPFLLYDDRSDLQEFVLSVARQHGDLYAGTSQGLYVLRSHSKAFRPVPGISGNCWSLLSTDHSILAATMEGVFQVGNKNKIERKVLKDVCFVLASSRRYPGRVWCGTNKGLRALIKKNNRWIEGDGVKEIEQIIRYIAEDKKGSLWLVTYTGGVIKVDFPFDIDQPVVTTLKGLPGSEIYAARAAGHVMFGTKKGIFRFDEKNNAFIPDLTLGPGFGGGPDSRPIFVIIEDKNKNIWFHSESRNYQAIPGPGGAFTIYSNPFRRIPLGQVNAIYPDPNSKATWFAGFEGLIRYDSTVKKNYQQDFPTLIRKVIVNGNIVFDGYKYKTDKGSKHLFPTIDYKDRKNFHFEFAGSFFEAETATQYRCLLEGHDDHWSEWDSKSNKDFTILDSGLYRFRVQAKNVYGYSGIEAVFQFKILPPWYRTWWAFLLYGIGLFLLIFLVVKWRSIKLEKETQRLEEVVKERTREIEEKKGQLETQTLTLKDQSEKLKEMDRVKSRFFANISHEFRTPLTLIMSPLDQMLSDSGEKDRKKKLKVMLRNSQRLLTLINQLLDLSRFDSGKIRLKAGFQNIVPLLKNTLESFHLLALQNKLDLEFHPEAEDISLYFDARRIEELMYNLLINAFKFTPAGGKIKVSVSVLQGERQEQPNHPGEKQEPPGFVKISVSDTGIGISKDQLAHIFDRFFQTEDIKENARKGTGIGLALAKEVVTLHHGKINVHSQAGKGTEFVIQLPMGDKHLKPNEIVISSETASNYLKAEEIERLYIDEEEEANGDEGEGEGAREGGAGTEAQEKNVILVVEDHVDVRRHIRDALKPLYTVIEAGDGMEGIEKAKKIIPDLIVSDIMMPEVDGYELCRVLKKDVDTSHVPVLLLTAKASDESIIQGLETGADDYVTKPFNTKILLSRIKNLIELRRQLQQKIQRQKMLLPTEIPVSSVDEKFFKEFQDIIEKNLSDPEFNVDVLFKKLYMGRSTLFRKIQALTGETPNQFILSYRLERAAQLLRDNFGNVTEVAMEVGFSSPPYFAKCFKEKFHQSPSSYQASESKASQ